MISDCIANGGWVLLQNMHLSLPFCTEAMDALSDSEDIHSTFRMWITTEVHPQFPIALLQVNDFVSTGNLTKNIWKIVLKIFLKLHFDLFCITYFWLIALVNYGGVRCNGYSINCVYNIICICCVSNCQTRTQYRISEYGWLSMRTKKVILIQYLRNHFSFIFNLCSGCIFITLTSPDYFDFVLTAMCFWLMIWYLEAYSHEIVSFD